MEILVCIKEVVDDSVKILMNPATQKPELDSVERVVNAFDSYALEMATRLKEEVGGNISVLSLGGERSSNSLKNCLAVGADEAYRIQDEDYQDRESIHVAEILAKGIQDLEATREQKFDIIFCGKESTDFASGQVGIMLADILDYGVATNVVDLEVKEKTAFPKRETEEGYQRFEIALPCLVTVNKPNYEPRYPTIKSKMIARKKNIHELPLGPCGENIFEEVQVFAPAKRQAGLKLQIGTVEELVAEAMKKMIEAKVV